MHEKGIFILLLLLGFFEKSVEKVVIFVDKSAKKSYNVK